MKDDESIQSIANELLRTHREFLEGKTSVMMLPSTLLPGMAGKEAVKNWNDFLKALQTVADFGVFNDQGRIILRRSMYMLDKLIYEDQKAIGRYRVDAKAQREDIEKLEYIKAQMGIILGDTPNISPESSHATIASRRAVQRPVADYAEGEGIREPIKMTPRPIIVHAEDDRGYRRTVEKLMTEAEYDVRSFKNGEEALQEIKKLHKNRKTPILITDWQMPFMTGLELLTSLRDEGINLPTVVHSDAGNMKEELEKAGITAQILTKSATLEDIKNAVGKARAECIVPPTANTSRKHAEHLKPGNSR